MSAIDCDAITHVKSQRCAQLHRLGCPPLHSQSTPRCSQVNVEGFPLPVKKLKGTDPTEALDFSRKSLRLASAVVIAALIRVNRSLTSLDLSRNQLLGVHPFMGSTGVEAIADALVTNSTLAMLDMRNNHIEGDAATRLATVVLSSKSMEVFNAIPMKALRAEDVTVLDLSSKDLMALEAHVIGDLAAKCRSLTSLDVRHNDISGTAAKQLASAVLESKSLEFFSLIPMKAVHNLGTTSSRLVPKHPRGIQGSELELNDRGLGPVEAHVISSLAAKNMALTSLSLGGNSLKDEGISAICEAIQSNKESKLALLDISRNSIGPEGVKKVVAMAAATLSLTEVRQGAKLSPHWYRLGCPPSHSQSTPRCSQVNLDGFPLPVKKLNGTDPTETLDFSEKDLGFASAAVIASLIAGNGSLRECNMSGNSSLDRESAERLASVAKAKGIMLFGIKPGQMEADFHHLKLTHADAIFIASDAAVSANLDGVNLDGFALPVKKLKGTDPVYQLDLSNKRLGMPSAIVIANLIAPNRTLTRLNLTHNRMTFTGEAAVRMVGNDKGPGFELEF